MSPDGQTVAVGIGGANTDVWLYGAYDAASRRLTEGGRNIGAAWTPDGRAVTYASDVDGAVFDIFERQADGSGDVETMLTAPSTLAPMSWTPDGETLIYYEVTATQNRDIRSLGRDGQTTAFLATEYNERALALSPDGRWLAYVSDQAGEDRVYVQAFPEGGSVYPVSTGPATEPAWSHDGTELFFRDGRQMLAVTVEPGDNFSASEPTALFDDRFELDTTRVGVPNYDVAADGRFLMVGSVDPDGLAVSPSQINIVLDWSEELAARLPAP